LWLGRLRTRLLLQGLWRLVALNLRLLGLRLLQVLRRLVALKLLLVVGLLVLLLLLLLGVGLLVLLLVLLVLLLILIGLLVLLVLLVLLLVLLHVHCLLAATAGKLRFWDVHKVYFFLRETRPHLRLIFAPTLCNKLLSSCLVRLRRLVVL